MSDVPLRVIAAERRAADVGFEMSCSRETGRLLRVLAASKPSGRLLEIGTGIGVGAAWLLDGMSPDASLTSLEIHPEAAAASQEILDDDRVEVVCADVRDWLAEHDDATFDLIFADVGLLKFEQRSASIRHLAPGGLFVADDLLPQPKWVETHAGRVEQFRAEIYDEPALASVLIDWGSGLSVSSRR